MDRTALQRCRIAVAGAAAALLAATLIPSPARAGASIAEVDVYDRTQGQALDVRYKFAKRWIVGEPGHEYAIRVRNCSDVRLLAVISVDGVNAITGQTASPSQSGYVIEPGDYVTVEGWRKSLDRTAAFVFTDPSSSYAARTGRPDDLGVIGVAMFRERSQPAIAQHGGAPLYGSVAEAEAPAPAAKSSAADSAARERSASLGTGHGRNEHSPAQWTAFERAGSSPDDTISIRYETRAALMAMGVLPRVWPPRHDPDPFPAQLGFAPDP